MLHILFIILKIIGIILLCVLALFLVLLGIILFIPVRYRVKAYKYEEIHANMNVSWLLRILYVKAYYSSEEKLFYYVVRILGLPIIDSRRPKKVKKKKTKKEKIKNRKSYKKTKKAKVDSKDLLLESKIKKNEDNEVHEDIDHSDSDPIEDDFLGGIDNFISDLEEDSDTITDDDIEQEHSIKYIEQTQSKTDKKENFIKKVIDKIREFFRKINNIFHSFKERIKKVKQSILNIKSTISNIMKKIHIIKEFLRDEKNKEGFQCTFASIKKVIKYVLPYKIKGEIKFGLDDPCNTGYVLGALSLLYPIYQDKLVIVPDFEQQVIEGKVVAKGRIRTVTLLRIGIKLILDKKFKMLLKNARNLKEEF